MTFKEAPRDVIACENTVIHRSSTVQHGFGHLVLDKDDLTIRAGTAQLVEDYDDPTRLEDVFQDPDACQIREELVAGRRAIARFHTLRRGEMVWASAHASAEGFGIDLTYVDDMKPVDSGLSRAFADCVQAMSDNHEDAVLRDDKRLDDYFGILTAGAQQLTGFDRVMLYQFDADLNGEVIAETCRTPQIDSFLGLKYPSSDIPKPARDLFLLNRVRQVVDVDAPAEQIVSTDGARRPVEVDQERSIVRYTSPVHLDYLRNMGVRATVVIGIVVRRKLWGLLSCHNDSGPIKLSPHILNLCHVLSDIASNHIARLIEGERAMINAQAQRVLSSLSVQAMQATTPREFARTVAKRGADFLAITKAQGLVFQSENVRWVVGDVPPDTDRKSLTKNAQKWRASHGRSCVATADLHRFCGDLSKQSARFGGFADLESWDRKSRLQVFRTAMTHTETWAGDPDGKLRLDADDPAILHPRNSFAAYTKKNSGCAEPWQDSAVEVCHEVLTGLRTVEMTLHRNIMARHLRKSRSEIKNALTDAHYRAMHDVMTGLPNRRGFEDFMLNLRQGLPRRKQPWLCHVDVDDFKTINDRMGHLAGDAVLKHIANLLDGIKGRDGMAARIGGDEFVVVFPNATGRAELSKMCEHLNARLARPFHFEGEDIKIGCTLGLTRFEPHTETIGQILTRSDLALYSGKSKGRGQFTFFSKDMEEKAKRRRRLEAQIEEALEQGAFVPHFQPQFSTVNGELVGCEVLSRWRHPRRGLLGPAAFMDAATEMGVIGDIDKAMFDQAVVQQATWRRDTGTTIPISVNVSIDRLKSEALLDDLRALGDGARNVTLELLESIDLDDHEGDHRGVVDELRKTGVGIEIDDFGTGRTSILAMISVRPDRLKIDRRLIKPIVREKSARELVKTILEIGSQLGITAVAEGVETRNHSRVLRDLSCERMQGFYLGRPQAGDAFGETLKIAV